MTFARLFARAVLLVVSFIGFTQTANATNVRLTTTLGVIEVELYDAAAPRTVANFLAYVNSGAYNNTFIHRSVPGFVIQGGGYRYDEPSQQPVPVASRGPIQNEFSPTRSNVRGTIAMAKVDGNPNSATSEWFINLANNASILDGQNGGFTVFGKVTDASMAVVDAIAARPIINASGAFSELPLATPITGQFITRGNLVMVETAATPTAGPDYTGLWWNPSESGWGVSLRQRGNIIFAAMYTYDAQGQPQWYVMSNCTVTGSQCTGDIYRVTGGSAPTVPWAGANRTVSTVGTGTFVFTDANNGVFSFNINNAPGAKIISRQIFATSGTAPANNYTDLWYNPNESGWGLALTQQFGIIFAAWFTYDAAGQPIWYVASNCSINAAGTGCFGDLFRVVAGSPLTATWAGQNRVVTRVGDLGITFNTFDTATLNYTVSGVQTTRTVVRQVF